MTRAVFGTAAATVRDRPPVVWVIAQRDRKAPATRPGWIAAAFVVVLAITLVVGLMLSSDEAAAPDGGTSASNATIAPIEVEATSIYQFTTLAEMVGASDAIVVGTVVATERGRLIGDPDNGGVISRLVTIEVDDVLRGEVSGSDATVIVEEEGFLPDGTPIVVNGVAASAVGDRGIWFLDALDDAELPVLLVINSQGRFLVDGDALRGGDQRDALVEELQRQPLDDFVAAVRELAPAPATDG